MESTNRVFPTVLMWCLLHHHSCELVFVWMDYYANITLWSTQSKALFRGDVEDLAHQVILLDNSISS